MLKSKTRQPLAKAAGLGIGLLNTSNSTANSRGNQATFFADRAPDRTVGGQPYWHLGEHSHLTLVGIETRLDLYLSLCARCGAPFFVTVAGWPYRNCRANRRCPDHRKPGVKVKRFEIPWTVRGRA